MPVPDKVAQNENPRRFFEGVDTSGLECAVDQACDLIDSLRAQRDELLDLLSRMHKRLTDGRISPDSPEWAAAWIEEIEAAIAKVEGS